MRILITGFVVFVIWCFVSAWLYNDHLLPVLRQPVPVPQVVDTQARAADSLMKIRASMPKDIIIYFEFDKTKLKTDAQTDIAVGEIKAWVEKYPGSKIVVSGHTDLVGTPEFNQDLGMQRAVIVTEYLKKQGIPPEWLITESQGETKPAAGYVTAGQRAKNRRTEITIKLQ